MSENYTQTMRRRDHVAFCGLVEKQQTLHRQLEAIAQDLLTLAGKLHDHAAGLRHTAESCLTCALEANQP